MSLAFSLGCPFSREWSLEELRHIVEEHQTGADLELLARSAGVRTGELLHLLKLMYFGLCCVENAEKAGKHGTPWTRKSTEALLSMYHRGCSVEELASSLGRSTNAISLKLIHDRFVAVPRELIHLLGLDPEEYFPRG